MSIDAIFEGGPFDGTEMALIGELPTYMLLIDPPKGTGLQVPLVVGAGFDDRWPGQARYDLDLTRTHLLIVGEEDPSGEAVYVYADDRLV